MTISADPNAARDYAPGWHARTLRGALDSPGRVVPLLMELVRPRSVLDVGCGPGTWLAAFREHGVTDVLGVDAAWLDRSLLQVPPEQVLTHDLRTPLELGRRFDLAIALEVGEHLTAEAAPTLVETLASAAPVVAFSAAIPFQGGTHHVNERWPDYWAALFAVHGFVPVDGLRLRLWDDESVAWYYRQNLVLFVDGEVLDDYPELRAEHERFGGRALRLVHPDRYTRLARSSLLRLLENARRWATARFPRTMRVAMRIRLLARRR